MSPGSRFPPWLARLTAGYWVLLAVVSGAGWLGADRWWLGALNLYLPQWLWALPGLVLTVWTFVTARRWLWVPLVCLLWVAGPIMGFQVPFPWRGWSAADEPTLRVMTWNVKYGRRDIFALIGDIVTTKPDLLLMQDAQGTMRGPLGDLLRDWNVRSHGQYVTASRLPLSEGQVRWISFAGEKHTSLRCELQLGPQSVAVYNVHFQTPRRGLNALRRARRRPWALPSGVEALQGNVAARLEQAEIIAGEVRRETIPVIVAGDLNSPDASAVCRELRGAGLRDAFEEAGFGYGYTYGHFLLERRLPEFCLPWLRIDHIMINSRFEARRCWTGTAEASDHRPVIADLGLGSVDPRVTLSLP
ncbi:MAG: endonuclease/exonuclease/phosphatase family protein [Deltaproteobacteria bacterium]|nr:endonuclease/exonuclease/phosphatase family protein [Deltaproteobacteria bacterium]